MKNKMNQVTTTTNNTDAQQEQPNAVPVGGNAQLTAQNTETIDLPKAAEDAAIVAPQNNDGEQLPEQPADADEQLPAQPNDEDETKKEPPPQLTEPLVMTAKREHFTTPHAVEIARHGETIMAVRLVNQQETEIIGATTLEAIVRANGGEIPAGDTDTLEIKFSPRTGTVMSISAVAGQS